MESIPYKRLENLAPWAKPPAFTLIELMVVIAVIFILAALLAPALRGAMDKAKDVQCGQNMRQIHMAILVYARDHGELYPRLSFPGAQHQYEQLSLFSNCITEYRFYRCPYGKGDVLQVLPAEYSTNINGRTEWTEYKIGDDDNNLLGQPIGVQLRPDRVVYVMDALDWNPRHRGKSNLCFADGHIELLSQQEYDGAEPGRSSPLGWFAWGLLP